MNVIRKSIKDQIYEILKERILTGELGLGDKINIPDITKELNVSNTPIREALSMLERDGLVEMRPNAGHNVIEFSETRFRSIEQSACMLTVASFISDIWEGKIDKLIPMLEDALKKQTSARGNCSDLEFAHLSMGFDECFIKCMDNEYIQKLYDEIRDIFFIGVLYDHMSSETEQLVVIEEHRKILESIRSGDYEKAQHLIRDHYRKVL